MNLDGVTDEQLRSRGWWRQWAPEPAQAATPPSPKTPEQWQASFDKLPFSRGTRRSDQKERLKIIEAWAKSGVGGWEAAALVAIDHASTIDPIKIPKSDHASGEKMRAIAEEISTQSIAHNKSSAIRETAEIYELAVSLGNPLFARTAAERFVAVAGDGDFDSFDSYARMILVQFSLGREDDVAAAVDRAEQFRTSGRWTMIDSTSQMFGLRVLVEAYLKAGRSDLANVAYDDMIARYMAGSHAADQMNWQIDTVMHTGRKLGRVGIDPRTMDAGWPRYQAGMTAANHALEDDDLDLFEDLATQIRADLEWTKDGTRSSGPIDLARMYNRGGNEQMARALLEHTLTNEEHEPAKFSQVASVYLDMGDGRAAANACVIAA
ncbi:MAG: hypothetical protein AAFY46_13265, partial [Planctomycetota bacterium]